MVRHSKETIGFENIVLNLDDGVVIKMTVGDLRKIIIDSQIRIKTSHNDTYRNNGKNN